MGRAAARRHTARARRTDQRPAIQQEGGIAPGSATGRDEGPPACVTCRFSPRLLRSRSRMNRLTTRQRGRGCAQLRRGTRDRARLAGSPATPDAATVGGGTARCRARRLRTLARARRRCSSASRASRRRRRVRSRAGRARSERGSSSSRELGRNWTHRVQRRCWRLECEPFARRNTRMLKDAPTQNGHVAAESPAPRRRVARTVRPARVTRRLARAPGTAVAIALLLLAAVGVKATLAPRAVSTPAPQTSAAGVGDITEQGFAQSFARAYLSWDAQQPDQHQRQVAPFLSGALDGNGGLQAPSRGQQQVLWTTAIQDQTRRARRPPDHGGRADHPPAALPRRPGAPDGAGIPGRAALPGAGRAARQRSRRGPGGGARRHRRRAARRRAASRDQLPRRRADRPARRSRSRGRRLASDGGSRGPLAALDHKGRRRPRRRRGRRRR